MLPFTVSAQVISIVSFDVVPLTIKEKVRRAFPEEPRMVKIVQCESKFRQFDSRGNTLRSVTSDYGIMQIHLPIWGKKAKQLGLDIMGSIDDNIAMGRHIYEVQGIKAWACLKLI